MLSSRRAWPVAGEQAVLHVVLEPTQLTKVLAAGTFVAHPDLSQDTPRGWVAGEVPRMDPVEAQLLEPVAYDLPGCLGGVAPAPVGHTKPVTDLCVNVLGVYRQLDGAAQRAALTKRDGEGDRLTGLVRGTVRGDPLLGHAVLVRVRDGVNHL